MMSTSSSGGGGSENGGDDLMADAARSCERMEDRLLFQRQLGRLRDTIYAQAEELNARKRERRSWGEERAELMRELQERDERIRGLERKGRRRGSCTSMNAAASVSAGGESLG